MAVVLLFRDTNMAIVRSRENTLWQNVAQVLSNNRAKRLSTNVAAVMSGAVQELVQIQDDVTITKIR